MAQKAAAVKATKAPAKKLPTQGSWRLPISSRDLGFGVLLLATLLFVYLPALHGGILWDDTMHLTAPDLRSWDGLSRIWFHLGTIPQYYPLAHTAFWLEFQIWSGALVGYHLINVIEHAVSAFLLVAILRRLAIPGAWLAAFLFALHPVQTESVAWISEQKNTLSTVFYLASGLVYLRFDRDRSREHYFIALTLFVMALLSKTVTATLPACLLVILWWKRGRLDLRRDAAPLGPWLAIGVAAGIFTSWIERTRVGAHGSEFALSFLQRSMLAGRVICFYAAKLVWPVNLTFIYPHWTIDPRAAWQYLFPAAVLAAAAGVIVAARKHRGPLAAFLFFVGTLVPVLGFLNVYPFRYSYVADHFQYVACLGLIVPAAALLSRIPSRYAAVPAVLVSVLAFATWARASVYLDGETLYRDTISRNPESWMAHNNLAGVLMQQANRIQEAKAELETVVRLNPNVAEAHINLGSIYASTPGAAERAIAEYRAGLRIEPNNPEAHNNLGTVLSDQPNRLPEAISEYRAALRIDPNYAEAHTNLGSALLEDPLTASEGMAELRTAVDENPGLAEAQANLGVALAKQPDTVQEAIVHLKTALQLRPDLDRVRQILSQIDPPKK